MEQISSGRQENSVIDTVIPSNLVQLQGEVQEVPFFTRKNNLIAEFGFTPSPIHSSNSDEIIGYQDADGNIHYIKQTETEKIEIYRGYVIKFYYPEELTTNMRRINRYIEEGKKIEWLLTEEEYKNLQEYNKAGEMLLADDVELLKSDPNYAKPNLVDPKTYVLESVQQNLTDDMLEKLKDKDLEQEMKDFVENKNNK